MKTDGQLTEQLLELQEHPERLRVDHETSGMQVADEQLRLALSDSQMHELVEQMAFAKRAFKNEELKATEPDVEEEWEKFAAKNFGEEHTVEGSRPLFGCNHSDASNIIPTNSPTRSFSFFTPHSSLQKTAASFIGVLLVSSMAFAAIHIVRMAGSKKTETIQVEQPVSYKPSTALPADTVRTDTAVTMQPIVFDNVPLEKMLPEIAAYYNVEVSFRNEEDRHLRFHFVWKREDGLAHAIEKLNRFESLSVRLDENIITIE